MHNFPFYLREGDIKMAQTFSTHHQSIELVERFAQCLLKDCKDTKDTALVKELAPYVTYFSNEIEMNAKRDQIFESFLNIIETAEEKPDCDDTLRQFREEINKAETKIKSSGKCEKYNSFMEMISEHLDGDDEEIKTVSESVSTIDPISKLPIVDPVKNVICGHSYEKNSILQLIQKNSRTRCPIPGCNATDFVKKADLVPDLALKRLLASSNSKSHKKIRLHE